MKKFYETEGSTGTEQYYRIYGNTKLTDGTFHIATELECMWFFTDAAVVLEALKETFFTIYAHVFEDDTCYLVIEDGNDVVLYMQHYTFTDLRYSIKVFAQKDSLGVTIMVPSEY